MTPTLKAKGFRCTVEEAILSNHQNGYTHILSLVGTREVIKAPWARFMKGKPVLSKAPRYGPLVY